jgi:3-hydroxyacyl-[acyl-carrier-protein] dehydratase
MLNIKQIQEILPHRYPFLLIDAIDELEPGKKAIGRKNVTMNEYFFQGHFPTEPVMPGVLILEALAQTGAVALLSLDEFKGKIALFAAMDKVKFRKQVFPGDVLRLEVEIIKMKGNIGIGRAVAYVGSQKATEAELTFAIGK